MSDTTQSENRVCAKCGKPIVDSGTGGIAHVNGGTVEQRCQNCGWTGGQYGKYTQCPRCGDQTSLIDDHIAS